MTRIAFIGGTGLTTLSNQTDTYRQVHNSPYGEPSAPLTFGKLNNHDVVFLPRHGSGHTIPPHQVNYRANLYVLRELQVEYVVAVNAVGGISADMPPPAIVIPDQVVDYTYSRQHTFYDGSNQKVEHVDFTEPYCEKLRQLIIKSADQMQLDVIKQATYAATQGPRLESAAEINRLERDGCHIVGMTGMPETSLARELGLCYASISIVANEAAGRGDGELTIEAIEKTLALGMGRVKTLLEHLVNNI